MWNGKATIVLLTVALITNTEYKWVNIFQNENFQKQEWKRDLKNATGVDSPKFAKKVDLADLKCDTAKLDIDKLKNVPTNLSNLKNKVDKLDVAKFVSVPLDLSKLSNAVKMISLRKRYIMLRSKIFKIKYLMLQT